MGASLKYTDRDVREGGEELYQKVVNFLERYEGEFTFLIDCKMRLAQGMDLHVGMVRGVLNCMRVDPRETDLPEPILPTADAEVIEMPKRKVRKLKSCDREEFHGPHGHYGFRDLTEIEWEEDPYYACKGKYAINRDDAIWVPAKINRPAMISRTSNLIHRIGNEAGFQYFANRHGWGYYMDPVLGIKTVCTFPRWISRPILLTDTQSRVIPDDQTLQNELNEYRNSASKKPIQRCKRCFA